MFHRGKKRVHKIEAFNDIKRDQKPREYQERRRRGLRVRSFLRALGAGETFSSRRLGISISTRGTYFSLLREASFFFPGLLPSLREGRVLFFFVLFSSPTRGAQKTNIIYFHKITRRITSARVIYYLPLSLNRSGRKFKLSDFLLRRDCVARRR